MPQVELYELGPNRTVLDELAKDLTPRQMAHVERHLRRLETHGRDLGPTYFEKVKISKRGLSAFRITADKAEVRLLYRQVGDMFVVVHGFVKKGMDVPAHIVAAADKRWDSWEEDHK
ncbi:MAG TPA: type II toxin-antitoxin system RelE/ParE family toxin [Gemmatimonadales bacterium]|jgi:phage-related protein|nr:type II toxin-antitoxin system RelE/ParE family toxin [Gemmatimonadales bacterium]